MFAFFSLRKNLQNNARGFACVLLLGSALCASCVVVDQNEAVRFCLSWETATVQEDQEPEQEESDLSLEECQAELSDRALDSVLDSAQEQGSEQGPQSAEKTATESR